MKRTRPFVVLCVILLILPAVYQLWWLMLGTGLVAASAGVIQWKKSFLQKCRVYYPLVFTMIFAVAIAIRVFLVEIYTIPSSSMEDTLLPGDKILVSKTKYGPRMPRSPFEIPWVNLFFFLNDQARERIDDQWWNNKRLAGTQKTERNDIVVFNHVNNHNHHFIKRCTGLPGDTLQIKWGHVWINGRPIPVPGTVRHRYRIWYNDRKRTLELLDDHGLHYFRAFRKSGGESMEISATSDQATMLASASCIDSLSIIASPADTVARAFPWHQQYLWTYDNFGPLIIPKRGMKMMLDTVNINLYRKILRKFDCGEQPMKLLETRINQRGISEYVFSQDYYFMMGDNRYSSNDSRGWGLVPEDHFIGNAVLILFSTNMTNRALARTLTSIE